MGVAADRARELWEAVKSRWSRLRDGGERSSRFYGLLLLLESQDTSTWTGPGVQDALRALVDLGRRRALSAADLSRLEAVLVRYAPDASLRQWAVHLRADYRALVGEDPPWPAESVPRIQDLQGDDLRATVAAIAGEIQRFRSVRRALGLMRTIVCGVGLLFTVAFFIAGTVYLGLWSGVVAWKPVTGIVVLAGLLGGFISGLSRVYQLSWTGDLLRTVQSVPQLGCAITLNLLFSVLEGGVFALILYVVFIAGLVQGALFPEFTSVRGPGNFETFFGDGGPKANVDVAKVIVWSFAAGFLEQLVPDLLKQLGAASRIRQSDEGA